MNVETLKEKLKWSIAISEKITGKNLSLPTLAYVFLEAKDRSLSIRATNLDLGIAINVPAKVLEEGQVMVSGSVMANFLGSLYKNDKITLTTVTNTLTVATETTTSVLKTYPTDDFPTIPMITDGQSISLYSNLLLDGFRSVLYAASLSDIKPEIASVYIYYNNGDLVFVATDSFRLAEKRIKLDSKLDHDPKLIIPIRNVAEIVRVFENTDELVTITYNNHQVSFKSESIYLTSRLIEGIFPDYRQIMPTSQTTKVGIAKQELITTLRLSTVFSDKLNQVSLRIVAKDKLAEVTSRNSDVGETNAQLSASVEGEDLEIGFNVRYLMDCLSSIGADSLVLAFNGRGRPIVVRGVGDNTFSYLIMPLNR